MFNRRNSRVAGYWLVLAVLLQGSTASTLAQAVPFPLAVPNPTGLRGQPVEDYKLRVQNLIQKLREREGLTGQAGINQARVLAILVGANPAEAPDYETQKFRQPNDFAYLSGFDEPGAVLVLNVSAGTSTLYVREHGATAAGFSEGQDALNADEVTAKKLSVNRVAGLQHMLGDLFKAIQDPAPLAANRPAGPGGAIVYSNANPRPAVQGDPTTRLLQFIKEGAPATNFKDLRPDLGELRKVKSEAEVLLLQRAIDITGEAEHAVARMLNPGLHEFQLEGRIVGTFAELGASRPGFKSIVGSGPNSCIPHYFLNNRQIQEGDLVVVDIGAEYLNYTADVTRTFPASGKFSARQRELYQLVLDAQAHASSRFEPGKTTLMEMDAWAREFIRKSPLRAKDASGTEQTMDRFFIHGLGHYLGMDVHDVGNGGLPMQPGEVFTIEPGLYISGEQIGIRIEDDYLVTPNGLRKLTGKIASTPAEVEAWMAEGQVVRNGQARTFQPR